MKNIKTFDIFVFESLIAEGLASDSPKSKESFEDLFKNKPDAFDHICKLFDFKSRHNSKDQKELDTVIRVDKLSKKEDPKLGQIFDFINKKFKPIGISFIDLTDIAYDPNLNVIMTDKGREKAYYFTTDSNF
jgi:hypothetical protein